MVIEPTSLEGMVWRDYLRSGHGRTAQFHHSECFVEAVWEETDQFEPVPMPAPESEHLLPIPAEMAGPQDHLEPVDD
jgi:hypothetical protein